MNDGCTEAARAGRKFEKFTQKQKERREKGLPLLCGVCYGSGEDPIQTMGFPTQPCKVCLGTGLRTPWVKVIEERLEDLIKVFQCSCCVHSPESRLVDKMGVCTEEMKEKCVAERLAYLQGDGEG